MKRHHFTLLILTISLLAPGCSETQLAQKAPVDIKAAAPPKPDSAVAAKPAGGKPAQVDPKPGTPATAAGQKPGTPAKAVDQKPGTPAASASQKPGTPAAAANQKPGTPAAAASPKPGTPAEDANPKPGTPAVAAGPKPGAPAEAANQKPGTPAAAANQKPGTPAAPAKDQEDDELKPLTVPAGFRYQADGRRDPFVNPVPKPVQEQAPEKPLNRPDGLPGVLVSEVRLTGIIKAADVAMTKAILSVGRKTYFARQGDSLFDGVIKEIRPNEVVFMMVSASTRKPVNKELILSTGKTAVALAGEKR